MSAWPDLVATAVVGTERRALPPAVAADVAGIMDGEVSAGTVEEQLLVAAGVLGAWRRAGAATTTTGAGPLPSAAPEDERPAAPAKAVQLLELLLDGQVALRGSATALVAEWLTRCDGTGRRLPDHLLPRILDTATAESALRVPAIAAGGDRLRWLAGRNPAWAWAAEAARTGADPDRTWAEGGREARLALLRRLRQRDPALARTLLAGTWSTESAIDRARFVESLATGLSPDDEPFLEAALDDRAKAVRTAAAHLLAALPSSDLARRMADRVRGLVSVEVREARITRRSRKRLSVSLPESVDAAAARDGIVPDGAPPGTGRQAWALVQIVGATPLRFWEDELRAGPSEIVDLGAGQPEVFAGWVRAAVRQRDAAWARLLLSRRADPALLSAMPGEDAHRELAAALPRVDDRAAATLLEAVSAPWPPATSRAAVARLRSVEGRHRLVPLLPLLATALDPEVAPDVDAWAGSVEDESTRTQLRALSRTLSIRSAIAQELA